MTTLPSGIYSIPEIYMQLFTFEKVKHAQMAVVISLMHSVNEITVNVRYLFNRNGWTMHGGYDDVMLW